MNRRYKYYLKCEKNIEIRIQRTCFEFQEIERIFD